MRVGRYVFSPSFPLSLPRQGPRPEHTRAPPPSRAAGRTTPAGNRASRGPARCRPRSRSPRPPLRRRARFPAPRGRVRAHAHLLGRMVGAETPGHGGTRTAGALGALETSGRGRPRAAEAVGPRHSSEHEHERPRAAGALGALGAASTRCAPAAPRKLWALSWSPAQRPPDPGPAPGPTPGPVPPTALATGPARGNGSLDADSRKLSPSQEGA